MSVRLGVRFLADRWKRAVQMQKRDDCKPAADLVIHVKSHSSEAFFGCDSPLEAAVFSALLEIARVQDRVDPYVDP